MRNITLSLLLCAPTLLSAQNLNITFRSKISFPNTSFANVWGYAAGGHEYALVAGSGLHIIDVTNPDSPYLIVKLPCPSSEVQTFSHYAYVANWSSGLYIIDLQNLPASDLPWRLYTGDGEIAGKFMGSHTLHIDTTSGFLYAHASSGFGSAVLDLKGDPYYPKYAGKVPFGGYPHDGYVNNDTLYSAQIYEGEFYVIDMHDKASPKLLGTQLTPSRRTHNTWLATDRKTLFTTDETDGAYLASFDVSDPSDIQFLDKIKTNPDGISVPHNTEIIGNYAVTAWYTDGVSIADVSRPDNMVETGRFDTYPQSNNSNFAGCWGAYPYLPSGIILASNMNGELWVLSPNYIRAAYLEGVVIDSVTGHPIAGATVRFKNDPMIAPELSSPVGQFKAGRPESGITRVQIDKFGYYSREIDFDLAQGLVTKAEIKLVPRPVVKISGRLVQTNNNLPVPNGHVLISRDGFRLETKTDSDGYFHFDNLPDAKEYTIMAGAWGFQYKSVKVYFDPSGAQQNLTIALRHGYQDDFIFDYGWTVSGSSVTGIWERTLPGQNYPNLDNLFALGDQCYVTGIAENPISQNGVKNGTMYLVSPPIILSQFTKPLLSFAYIFCTQKYSNNYNESLEFVWDTGTEEIKFKSVQSQGFNWREFIRYPLKGLVSLNDTIHFKIKAIDNPDIVNTFYEAAFTWFNITEGSPTPTISLYESVYLNAMPNPFQEFTRFHYDLPESGFHLSISDITGRILQSIGLKEKSGIFELGEDLSPGVYFASLSKNGTSIRTLKMIKTP